MRRTLISGTAAVVVMAAAQVAAAQTATVDISPQQRTQIKEYVLKEKAKPVTFKERVTVGATLPADVELAPVPQTNGRSGPAQTQALALPGAFFI